MKHQIKHRFTESVLFECDLPDDTRAGLVTRHALEKATVTGAYLDGANLAGALLVGERPIFQIGPIGSRCAYFTAYLTSEGVKLQAGCFYGTVDEFTAKLSEEHGDNVHAKEYRAALDLIHHHAGLWTPPKGGEGS